MACSTCDGYEFVKDADGANIDCPDCRAIDRRPLAWCPVHSNRVQLDGSCLPCAREAARATAAIVARKVAVVLLPLPLVIEEPSP